MAAPPAPTDEPKAQSGDLFRNTKSCSDGGVEWLNCQWRVGRNECIPRFGGSTDEFFAIEGEVRAEDFDGEQAFLLRRSLPRKLVHFRLRFTS